MHHKEIGQFVEILEKYLTKDSETYPVRIEHVNENYSRRGESYKCTTGIRLIAVVGNSQIKIQIDSSSQDSNGVKVFYFAPSPYDRPSLYLNCESQTLNFTQIDSMLQVLIEVAKGGMCLRTLRAVGAIGDFKVMEIPIPQEIAS